MNFHAKIQDSLLQIKVTKLEFFDSFGFSKSSVKLEFKISNVAIFLRHPVGITESWHKKASAGQLVPFFSAPTTISFGGLQGWVSGVDKAMHTLGI